MKQEQKYTNIDDSVVLKQLSLREVLVNMTLKIPPYQ